MTLSPSHAVQCGLEDQPGKEDTTRITVTVLMVRRVNILTDLLDILQNPGCKGAQGRMRMLPGLRRPELTKKIKYLLLVTLTLKYRSDDGKVWFARAKKAQEIST